MRKAGKTDNATQENNRGRWKPTRRYKWQSPEEDKTKPGEGERTKGKRTGRRKKRTRERNSTTQKQQTGTLRPELTQCGTENRWKRKRNKQNSNDTNSGRALRGETNGGKHKQLPHTGATGNNDILNPQAAEGGPKYHQLPHTQETAGRASAEIGYPQYRHMPKTTEPTTGGKGTSHPRIPNGNKDQIRGKGKQAEEHNIRKRAIGMETQSENSDSKKQSRC